MIIMGYLAYEFIRVLVKMTEKVILPISEEEKDTIRTQPQRKLDSPTYTGQKSGIILYTVIFLFTLLMFVASSVFKLFDQNMYLLLLVPLLGSFNWLNMFAIVEDGVLCKSRFIPWERIKSFRFERIDINHRYYGHSKEVNDTYELKMETRTFTASCVVTSEEMKHELNSMLKDRVGV
ncbi:hypothetical protein RWE15_08975 [Virgibacillus halophilus]|uniref:DUF5673 domain-containing protein n=1 Tax=Tigheibacillus halophilus TaxID=361280 RepID=A0ABU5C5E4_9BACI|nr:hypothetical protein [Virgibacillus halophilus]